jgi:hypothetical protein
MINHGFRRLALAHSLLPGDLALAAAQPETADDLPLPQAGEGRGDGAAAPSPSPLPQAGDGFARG